MFESDAAVSKTSMVAKILAGEIRSGKFRPGEKLPSMRALGARFNVSTKVLYDASGHLEKAGLIRRGARSGLFIPDNRRQTALCGVVTSTMPGMKDNYFEALMKESSAAGCVAMIANADWDSIEAMAEKNPVRVFVDVSVIGHNLGEMRTLLKNTETVFFQSFEWPGETPDSAVLTDWVGMTERTLRFFLEKGHRRIVFLSHENEMLDFKKIQMREAAKRVGLEFDSPEFRWCGRYDFENNPNRLSSIFQKDPPTAIFSRSDYLLFEFLPKLEVYFPECRGIDRIGCYDTVWAKQPGREFSSWLWDWNELWKKAFAHREKCMEYYTPKLILRGEKK